MIFDEDASSWHTLSQFVRKCATALLESFPLDPKLGRVDEFYVLDILGWTLVLRIKVTIVHAVRRHSTIPPAPTD